MKAARIRILIQVIQRLFCLMLALGAPSASCKTSWLYAVTSDLAWLSARCDKLAEVRGAAPVVWFELLASSPKYTTKLAAATPIAATIAGAQPPAGETQAVLA